MVVDISAIIITAQDELERQGFTREEFYIGEPLVQAILRAEVCKRSERKETDINQATNEDIKNTVNRLIDPRDMGVNTLRFQYSYENILIQVDQLATNAEENQKNRYEDLLQYVLEVPDLQKSNHIALLYKSIFDLLIHVEGDQSDRITDREIAAALQAVFPQDEIASYARSSTSIKKTQIQRLPNLVLGVRLFNKHKKKDDDQKSLENLPEMCNEDFLQILKELDSEVLSENEELESYKKILDFEYLNPGTISASVQKLHEEVANRNQYMNYLKELQNNCHVEYLKVQDIIRSFDMNMDKLSQKIGNRLAIPKNEVFYIFQQLGEAWHQLKQNLSFCQRQAQIFNHLLTLKNTFYSSLNQNDLQIVNNVFISNPPITTISTDSNDELYLIHRVDFRKHNIKLEWQGFCATTCIDRNGFIMRSNLSLGVICYQQKYYSFATNDAMLKFSQNPQRYLSNISTLIIEHPYLVRIMGLTGYLRILSLPVRTIEKPLAYNENERQGEKSNSVSVAINTPTHFVDSHIDHEYRWNEWDMRRDALRWTNLQNKKTSSMQTDISHFRRDAQTQDYLKFPLSDGTMPGTEAQTMRTSSTAMPIKKRYICGLRGKPRVQMNIATLTLDWNQQRKKEW